MKLLSPFAQLVRKLVPSVVTTQQDETELALESSDESRIVSAIQDRVKVILVHGRAGTGKTTLIQKITRSRPRNAVVAFTGIAAVNAGGQTIHSFFRLPPGLINLSEIKPTDRLRSILTRLDLIIIDEISMVRADLLDAIDRTLRVNLGIDAPFGGMQMLLVGDFLQLPPIANEEESRVLLAKGYETPYAFGANSLRDVQPCIIELSKVYRQTDPIFLEVLGKVRLGRNLGGVVSMLNSKCLREHRVSAKPVILTGTNAAADRYNRAGLLELPGQPQVYRATVDREFKPGAFPVPEILELKVNARVMMAKNDPSKRWVNGSLGVVTRTSEERIWVRIDHESEDHQINQATWENIRYEIDPSTHYIKANVVGTYSQLPVRPAWAITIHKSQGLTLDDVRLDLGAGAFTNGQTYVALSRARTLEGLSFGCPLRISDIRVDENLVNGVLSLVSADTKA
jgi:ATP-dependent DNA helicase PIF1